MLHVFGEGVKVGVSVKYDWIVFVLLAFNKDVVLVDVKDVAGAILIFGIQVANLELSSIV